MHGTYNDLSDHVTKTGTKINWYQALKQALQTVSNVIFIYTYSLNIHISYHVHYKVSEWCTLCVDAH